MPTPTAVASTCTSNTHMRVWIVVKGRHVSSAASQGTTQSIADRMPRGRTLLIVRLLSPASRPIFLTFRVPACCYGPCVTPRPAHCRNGCANANARRLHLRAEQSRAKQTFGESTRWCKCGAREPFDAAGLDRPNFGAARARTWDSTQRSASGESIGCTLLCDGGIASRSADGVSTCAPMATQGVHRRVVALPASCDLEKPCLGNSTPQDLQRYVLRADRQGGHLISAPLASCDFEKADSGSSARHAAQVCKRLRGRPKAGVHVLAFALRRAGAAAGVAQSGEAGAAAWSAVPITVRHSLLGLTSRDICAGPTARSRIAGERRK